MSRSMPHTTVLPADDVNSYFINSSPSLPVRQKAPPPPSKPLSLIDHPVFKNLYANNEVHLRHFLDSHDALSRDNLGSLFEYVKNKGEPGPRVNYENIAYSLTAMRNFLGESGRGKLLVSYFRAVLRDHGGYIVTTAEVLAYEIVVNMIQALFVFNNDHQLYNHICTIVPEAPTIIKSYTMGERDFFARFAADKRRRLNDANAITIEKLMALKNCKDFHRKHRQLVDAHELHETKLDQIRKKEAQDKADRKARIQIHRARNDANIARQMGMNGLTELTAHVTNAVVDFVEEISEDFFPREDPDAYSEEQMLLSVCTAD